VIDARGRPYRFLPFAWEGPYSRGVRAAVALSVTLALATGWGCKSPRLEGPASMVEAGSAAAPTTDDRGPPPQARETSQGAELAAARCKTVAADLAANAPDRRRSSLARSGQALELAIARGDVECTRLLLDAGLDPNTAGARGQSLVRWLGSGQGVKDDDVLAVAVLLDAHHASFGPEAGAIDLLTNLAPRSLPKTLAFLAQKRVGWDYDKALTSIARRGDVASVEVLLGAGADPLSGPSRGSSLMDAASAGRTATVAAMLKVVRDKASPKVLAAYQLAVARGQTDTAQAFLAAGVQSPPPPIERQPACPRRELTADEAALMSHLGLPSTRGLAGMAGSMSCNVAGQCGTMLLVDCDSAADGPAYYLDRTAGRLLATCGGACMTGCRGCPPAEWTCSCRL